jgi:hypothetical protein
MPFVAQLVDGLNGDDGIEQPQAVMPSGVSEVGVNESDSGYQFTKSCSCGRVHGG